MSRLVQNPDVFWNSRASRTPNERGQLGGLAERGGGPAVVVGRGRRNEVGARRSGSARRGACKIASRALEVVPVRLALQSPREEQAPLPGRRGGLAGRCVSSSSRASSIVCVSRIRFQLGQPELDGPPAAPRERRQIGFERCAHGRGLADAGLHVTGQRDRNRR